MQDVPIVGISGKAKHGKDTLAGLLVTQFGFYRRGFADELKIQAMRALYPEMVVGMTEAQLLSLADALKQNPDIRAFLQAFGQAKRVADPEYWVKRVFNHWESVRDTPNRRGFRKGLVIPDVRYYNEAQRVKREGGLLVRVFRPNFDNGLTQEARLHSSECELDDYDGFDVYIENDGTPADMLYKLGRYL